MNVESDSLDTPTPAVSSLISDPNQDLINALKTSPESLEREYLRAGTKCLNQKPFSSLRTTVSDNFFPRSRLPEAWRTTQLALARGIKVSWIKRGCQDAVKDTSCDLIGDDTDSLNGALKDLLTTLYYHQLVQLVGEVDDAGADVNKQRSILAKMAEPLRRYSKFYPKQTL